MFSKIEYIQELRSSMISEKELIEEFGQYGWQLVSHRDLGLHSGFEYIFSRKKPYLMRVHLHNLEEKYFETGFCVKLTWSCDFVPRKGDSFNPMSFLQKEEIEYINKHLDIKECLTKAGIEAFQDWEEEMKDGEKLFFSDFLQWLAGKCTVQVVRFKLDESTGKETFDIWLTRDNEEYRLT